MNDNGWETFQRIYVETNSYKEQEDIQSAVSALIGVTRDWVAYRSLALTVIRWF